MIGWLVLLLLLLSSGLASGSETALFAVSQTTLRQFGRQHGLRRQVYRLMQHPRQVLMTVLITNTAINVGIFAVSYTLLAGLEATYPMAGPIGSVFVLLAVVLCGEIMPKAIALNRATQLSPFAGGVISFLQIVLGPLQWLLGTFLVEPITKLLAVYPPADEVSTEEMQLLVRQSARRGLITSQENEMLRAVLALGNATVREVMTPRVDMLTVRLTDSYDDIRQALRESRKRKLPVCGRDLDDIRGILYARHVLLQTDKPIEQWLRPVNYVPEQMKLMQLLQHFREQRMQFAVVVDEYGGTVGVVSLEDVLERIVGDLGEYDAPTDAQVEQIDDNTYRLPGGTSVREWAERFGVHAVPRNVDTLGGLILSRLGRVPEENDHIRIRNLTLTVERMNHHRIESILVRRDAGGGGAPLDSSTWFAADQPPRSDDAHPGGGAS